MKNQIISYLEKNPAEFIDGDPLYTVWLNADGGLTRDLGECEYKAQVLVNLEDLGYPYARQLKAAEECKPYSKKVWAYDMFCEKFGDPLEWLDEQENTLTPAFLQCVVEGLVEKVEKIKQEIKAKGV